MEKEVREVVISEVAVKSLEHIYVYGIENFAYSAATVFLEELQSRIQLLSTDFLHYPICRFLPTKTGKYRNFLHGMYLVIYRVTPARIEVLNIIHSSRRPSRMRQARKIKI